MKSIDEGRVADVIYMDFGKAFDKVPDGRLMIPKLEVSWTAKKVTSEYNGILIKWANQWQLEFVRKNVVKLERVQRRLTKMLLGLEILGYWKSLNRLELFPLECTRLRGDLIEVCKIMRGMDR
eukprot:g20766.t1